MTHVLKSGTVKYLAEQVRRYCCTVDGSVHKFVSFTLFKAT